MPTFIQPRDAWQYALNQIYLNGSNIITEDNALIREVLNLQLEIRHPLEGFPIQGSGS